MAATDACSRFCCQILKITNDNSTLNTSNVSRNTIISSNPSKKCRNSFDSVKYSYSCHNSYRNCQDWDCNSLSSSQSFIFSPSSSLHSFQSPLSSCRSFKLYQNYRRRNFGRCDLTSNETAEPDNGGLDSSSRGDFLQNSQESGDNLNKRANGGSGGNAEGSLANPNLDTTDSDYGLQGPWDLAARRRRIEEVASRMGDPLRDMVTTASKKLQEYLEMNKRGSGGKVMVEESESMCQGVAGEGTSERVSESERERERNMEREGKSTANSEWENWERVFAEVEEKYNLLEALQFQLDDAVEREDFKEAARLKLAFESCGLGDPMATSLAEFQAALRDERYKDAARLRDQTATDLRGWWSGLGSESEDSYGRLVNISALQGRLVARSYTAKQIASASPGIPVFEIFVTREDDGNYRNQPVFLRRRNQLFGRPTETLKVVDDSENSTTNDSNGSPKLSVDGSPDMLKDLDDNNEDDGRKDIEKKAFEEGFFKAVDILKDKMSGMSGGSVQIISPEDIMSNNSENLVKAVLRKMAEAAKSGNLNEGGLGKKVKGGEEDREEEGEGNEGTVEGKDKGAEGAESDGESALDDIEKLLKKIIDGKDARIVVESKEDGFGVTDEKFDSDERLDNLSSFGNNNDDVNLNVRVSVQVEDLDSVDSFRSTGDRLLSPLDRVPAKIERRGRDEFVFHIEEGEEINMLKEGEEGGDEGWKMSAVLTVKGSTGNGVSDSGSKRTWNMEDLPMKPNDINRIVQMAMKQAKRGVLTKKTAFRRINLEEVNSDPLCGLYIGAFGPYTSEIVQLRRKFGRWEEDPSETPYEYVEAVKLTGDLNVPAGEVTFRAKVGRLQRQSLHGIYPDELGVVSRYKGQGRLAEHGFKNPRWIDGELILLDGKFVVGGTRQVGGNTNTSGAELGFVYSVPERHFLVLFNRLKLRM